MPKKPVKIIIKFSNDSTSGKGKDKPKKSGPSNGDSPRKSNGARKLRP